MNSNILDVFYNCLIKEASLGSVDCFFKYNMRFNTKIINENIDVFGESDDNSDLLIIHPLNVLYLENSKIIFFKSSSSCNLLS